MPEILIPLMGMLEIDINFVGMIGMVLGKTLLKKDAKLDDEMWVFLVSKKIEGRYRNLNDVIRVQFGFPPLNPTVKRFSDEGEGNATSY